MAMARHAPSSQPAPSKPKFHKNLSLDEALFNHLTLPPQLPHREDPNIPQLEDALLERVIASAQRMRDLPGNELFSVWDAVCRSLQATKAVNPNEYADRLMLARELRSLGTDDFLVIHVRCQNCALLVYRSKDDVLGPSVVFEAFEVAARNEDILAAENALQWTFPGCAVAVPKSTFLDNGFIDNIASFLENASRESIKDFSAHTLKAGTTVFEHRNTGEPSLITSMLMALLQENGRRLAPKGLEKMVRDDVCWKDASNPWRRLPYWLILRVAISRYLCLRLGAEGGRAEYKFFTAHLLSTFLADYQASTPSVQNLDYLKKKICRRIVKLESDKLHSRSPVMASRLDYLFEHLEPTFKNTIAKVSTFIEASWRQQKLRMTKAIPPLPRWAPPEELRLDLRVSGRRLQDIVTGYAGLRRRAFNRENSVSIADAAKVHLNSFARAHAKMVDEEVKYAEYCLEPPAVTNQERREVIQTTSKSILSYIKHAPKMYEQNPHLLSTMIMTIMELWVKMDHETCSLYPLLREFHPVFRPDMLDVLLTSHFGEMQRVQRIQIYLHKRIAACERSALDIFADPVRGAFGHRFYEESSESSEMKDLHDSIEEWAKKVRSEKEQEWRSKSDEYAHLSKQIDQSKCVFFVDDNDPLGRGTHDDASCPRCFMMRRINRLSIVGYEHPLPADQVIAKAVIFELTCPQAFAIYRDVTWTIISTLALPPQDDPLPKCTARDYEQLSRFANETQISCTLASRTKSFLNTHYASMNFPVEWESGRDGVCRPNGLRLSFFDGRSSVWPGRRGFRPSFLSHVKLNIPESSPFAKLLQDAATADGVHGPSSYEIMATASSCPSGINVHEYLAFQTIASGKTRRWFAILTELGSANLNFSNEATMLLLGFLISQCGPLDESHDPLRAIHRPFRDSAFCKKLMEHVSYRLSTLSANWREIHLMETVIALTLRIVDFAMVARLDSVVEDAVLLLDRAREICVRWFKLLRAETFKVTDAETAQRFQQYTLWAGLLCKRTFALHVHRDMRLDDAALEAFIQSSVIVQDSLVVKLTSLPRILRFAVFRDMRLSHTLCEAVSSAIMLRPDVFRSSLKELWPEEEGCPRRFSRIHLEGHGWISCQATTDAETNDQRVLYNCVEGVLLVDNRPMGKLPNDPEKSLMLTELFGEQVLLTYPSDRPGMQYTLCVRPRGFKVHVGDSVTTGLVIRAFRKPYSLQLIPREAFRSHDNWDLPGPMMDGHFHWLDLNTQQVLISKQPWPNYPFNGFKLDLNSRTCTKMKNFKGQVIFDSVVNPYSPLSNRAIRILNSLEYRRYITVIQPGGRRGLQVELPRLQILFHVNPRNMLQSPQLQVEIDPIQDAGTWYGLRSKLVCKSTTNPMHKFVLVPLGSVVARSDGCHVEVGIEPAGVYGKYTINKTLGQLDCTSEPRLVYHKALLHALTSFIIPDPLTGKTGTEEAIAWLQSGISQPWNPLSGPSLTTLAAIAQLTPIREYYPNDLRVMRTDSWTDSIPGTLQRSEYRPIVERIFQVSEQLSRFSTADQVAAETYKLPDCGEAHLHNRALRRSEVFERYVGDAKDRPNPAPRPYKSRDCPSITNIPHRNVLEIIHSIKRWPQSLRTTPKLAQILASESVVGGFGPAFDKASLNDRFRTNIVQNWGSLVMYAKNAKTKYDLMFLLGLMAFRLDADLALLRTLLAFAIFRDLQVLEPPKWKDFHYFQPGQTPQLDWILHLIKPFGTPAPADDREILGQLASAKQRRKLQNARAKHELKVEEDCTTFANFLLKQWPCLEPNAENLTEAILVDIQPGLEAIRPEWRRISMNMDLTNHIREVQEILDRRTSNVSYDFPAPTLSEDVFPGRLRGNEIPDLNKLLQKPVRCHGKVVAAAKLPQRDNTPLLSQKDFNVNGMGQVVWPGTKSRSHGAFSHNSMNTKSNLPEYDPRASIHELERIAQALGDSKSEVRKRYSVDFQKSLSAFRRLNPYLDAADVRMHTREVAMANGSKKVEDSFKKLEESIGDACVGTSLRQIQWLKSGGLWPAITKGTVLRRLSSTGTQSLFGSGMRKGLIELGISITELQREIRLHDLALRGMSGRYHEEESNLGHCNWKPDEHPNWLLLEIESNMMIRPIQVDVARATIAPESESNSVLQMNMGQGKTSCIIPMVAAALADRTRLVRVVVPKALLQQTAQLLQSRLGGILGRPVRHVPFSRRTPTEEDVIKLYHWLHADIMKTAGIMICQPEHHMSFMLSGRQRLLDNKVPEAGPMIRVHDWFNKVSRDILDESDYTLAVRTQLIYPSGSQMTVDGHPHRWLAVEAVLRLVNGHLFDLPSSFPHSISVIRRQEGSFPLIFFLRSDVEDELIRRVTADICRGVGAILPMNAQGMSQADRVAIKDFISAARPKVTSTSRIQKICPDNQGVRQTVYLLRGLLVNRILLMTLKKRWNVEYGLHPKRDPIAVPFHAKGVPSEQSEWGHPDVAILFTCLAFYYDGVNPAQLRQCLEHILKSDDPSTEYDKWTKSSPHYPSSLRAWNSINVDDEIQLAEIWRATRYNGVVIDYFLNNFVFPRHAKQFKVKLQSNGWDIPLFPLIAEPRSSNKPVNKPLTTGFSGTNDNRTMLPLTIQQHDLTSLVHTSAEVLTYLLHHRNRKCLLPLQLTKDSLDGRLTERDLLLSLKAKNIRILIDAGAQILEMDNHTLAQEWLKIDGSAMAALYFDEGNRPMVVSKSGKKTPLLASPFADDLRNCLVYLDEAHTRGTDLRLPPKACGALTLRLGQTKDHTVQAAMRLRQLGTSQSITFVVPPEVHQSIIDLSGKTLYDSIDSSDVIEWLLNNTCEGIEQLQPLYYAQGMDFCRRTQATLSHPRFLVDKSQRAKYVAAIKQEEQQTLQQLYEPKPKNRAMTSQTSTIPALQGFIGELNARRTGFQDTGKAVHASALQEVEQEREVAFEVESVRQIKKPQEHAAFSYPGLNHDLESFARTGRMPADAHYFTHVFASLANTGLGRKFRVSRKVTESKLYVTAEFDRTIKNRFENTMDNFLRPVNWVLWSPITETAVIVIPEEAEALISKLRDPDALFVTHLILYAAPITRKMLQFNDLTYYSIPSLPHGWAAPNWLRAELGLFAGRIYFEWEEYDYLCNLLGVQDGIAAEEDVDVSLTLDGAPEDGGADKDEGARDQSAAKEKKFAIKPLTFVQEWLAVRRRGQDFAHSPMGFFSQGKPLHSEHLFFKKTVDEHEGDRAIFAPVSHGDGNGSNANDNVEDDYQGVDDMGANEEANSDSGDDDIKYDESEYVGNDKIAGSSSEEADVAYEDMV